MRLLTSARFPRRRTLPALAALLLLFIAVLVLATNAGPAQAQSNNAPTVANAIPDQTATLGAAFSYAFPANTFNDADDDTLTYTATKSDGMALPSWLTFTAGTRTFSGTPQLANNGTLSVKVTASDGTASVSDTFDILVTPISSVTVTSRLVTVTFNQAFSNCPARRAWIVKVEGIRYPPANQNSGDCTSTTVTFELSREVPGVYRGETVTLGYDKNRVTYGNSGGAIRFDTIQLNSFSEFPVTNLSRDGAPKIHLMRRDLDSRYWYSGATVNGNVMTVTFHKAPDQNSIPAPSAFWVSSSHPGGCAPSCRVAVTEVSVSGATATLTLAETIPSHVRASFSYGPYQIENPLREPGGGRKWGRVSARATVMTPDTAPVFYAAKLGQSEEEQVTYLAVKFNEHIDVNSLPPGSAFQVTAQPRRGAAARTVAGTGTIRVGGDDSILFVDLARRVAPGGWVTVSYVQPSANGLRDDAGNLVESFSGKLASNGIPRIESVAIVSDPGSDGTYTLGDKVRVQVTFDGPVEVWTRDGTPRLKLSLFHGKYVSTWWSEERWATYEGVSQMDTLTFAYTVARGDASTTTGIGVPENALDRNGARVWTLWAWPDDADLAHAALDHDAAHQVDGRLPFFESAAVDGTALTLTFDETLDTASVPAPGDFHVTVNNARRNVADGGVAVSGNTVTLTLASAVEAGETVKVRYTRPSSNPLQGTARVPVETFADRAVTNNTVDAIWSAMLTVKSVDSNRLGCHSRNALPSSVRCSNENVLTSNSFIIGQDTRYQVTQVTVLVGFLVFELDKTLSQDWTLHVGEDGRFSLADATLTNSDKTARWSNSGLNWSENQQVSLRLTTSGPSGQSAQTIPPTDPVAEPSIQAGPTVTGVSVVSGAGADQTYGLGDTIQVTLTFSEAVDVTGTPRLKIDMDPAEWGEKWAGYDSGSGTASLTFTHTVVEPNISTQGIAVLENTLELNGGDIELKDTDNDAELSHDGLAHDSNHKVDWQTAGEQSGGGGDDGGVGGQGGSDDEPSAAPSVSRVALSSSPQANATYAKGETIQVTLTFSEAVDVAGTPRLKIDMDPADGGEKWAAYQGGSGTTAITFTHSVAEPNISTQGIAVLQNTLELNGGDIESKESDTDADLAHIGLAHDSNHKVDWRLPLASVTGVSVTSDPGSDDTYANGDVITITLTFSKAVNVDTSGGTPRLKIDMDPADWGEKWAAYQGGSGTTAITFTHTVVEPNISTQGIAVLENTLELNDGTIQSDGLAAQLAHTGLAHDSDHQVDWQQSDSESAANSAATGAPAITGTARVGETLTADTSGIADADGLTGASFSYQWLADGAAISGATGSNYAPANADVGKAVSVRVSFTDDAGHAETLTSAATAAVAAANPPEVTGVAVTSSPGSGDTYGLGEVIRISVTFDEAVDVTGTPQLTIDMDPAEWGAKQAAYQSGSGTTTLVFAHTVVEPNISTQGIAVLANTLALNGGDIESKATDTDADLSHTGLAHDAKHKVDWRPQTPVITGVAVTSSPSSGDTYGPGEVIRISVTFDEAVDVTGTPQLTIDMDPAEWGAKQAAYESGSGTTTLVFAHTVVEPNISTQGIAVLANTLALNGGDIESKATDTDADLSHTGLAHDAKHKVDWQQEEEGPGS